MMTPEDLTYIRDAQGELMTDYVSIESHAGTPDGRGGQTESYGAPTADLPARLSSPSAREAASFGDQFRIGIDAVLTIPYNVGAKPMDRVTVRSTGQVWRVKTAPPAGSWTSQRRLAVEPA